MTTFAVILGCFLCLGRRSLSQSITPSDAVPLSVPPSEYWDSSDGPWSSFHVQVGTPPQTVRLLPGTSATAGDTIWVVLPEGCTPEDPDDCAGNRGHTFAINQSTTWSTERSSDKGLFELSMYEEKLLGYSGNAYYGFDTVTLGLNGAGLPTLSHQLIAGFATKDFYLGSLGLSPLPFNFTSFNEPQPSLLQTLRNDGRIPSSSWAYTAGAYYREPKVFGSLTLGGYDLNRFVPNNVTVAFGADQSRDLLIGIQSITYDTLGSPPLLSTGIYSFINSMVPHIWLPEEVCLAFEFAFNLTWNDTAELYLVDDHTHATLVRQNPTITFKVGPSSGGGASVDIVMPYKAFDLTASAPLVDNTTRYFPLKRAQNSTQYTLGRTFLQHAYVIADYERRNFSVSKAPFPEASVNQQLIPITRPDLAVNATSDPASDAQRKGGLSKGAIAGIVLAVAVLVLFTLFATVLFLRRRSQKRAVVAEVTEEIYHWQYGKPELDTTESGVTELDSAVGTMTTPELDGTCGPTELAGHNPPIGRQVQSTIVHELPAENTLAASGAP